MAREETQVSKIIELMMARNRERGQRQRTSQKSPAAKRRKLDNEMHEARRELQEKSSQQKKKADERQESENQPSKKRKKTTDIRKLIQAQADKDTTNSQEKMQELPQEQQPKKQPIQENPPQDLHGVHFGEAEMVDWEEILASIWKRQEELKMKDKYRLRRQTRKKKLGTATRMYKLPEGK